MQTVIKPFDFKTENSGVEEKIEKAMKDFDYAESGYCLDTSQGGCFIFITTAIGFGSMSDR